MLNKLKLQLRTENNSIFVLGLQFACKNAIPCKIHKNKL